MFYLLCKNDSSTTQEIQTNINIDDKIESQSHIMLENQIDSQRLDIEANIDIENIQPFYNISNVQLFFINNAEFVINKIIYKISVEICMLTLKKTTNQEDAIYSYILTNKKLPKPINIYIYCDRSLSINNLNFNFKFGQDDEYNKVYAKFVNDNIYEIAPLIISLLQNNQWLFIKGINDRSSLIEFYCPVKAQYINMNNITYKTENILINISYNIMRNTCTLHRLPFNLLNTKSGKIGDSSNTDLSLCNNLEIPIDINTCISTGYNYEKNNVTIKLINNTYIQEIIQKYKLLKE